jgi:carboxypeptidase C (cathepsin A)
VQGLQKNDDQVGGMTWQLRGFTFASIKAAGHMAPKDNKKSAAVIFDSFINGIELPFKSE